MTRLDANGRKEKQSDFVNLSLVLTSKHYLTLIFHTLCRGGVLLSGVRMSFFLNNLESPTFVVSVLGLPAETITQ